MEFRFKELRGRTFFFFQPKYDQTQTTIPIVEKLSSNLNILLTYFEPDDTVSSVPIERFIDLGKYLSISGPNIEQIIYL